ncbi:MAG: VCBS repeat-containing protein [Candidatus Zixiibacteriota bacterium]|nr:MAG: VCBS repeat-containing protein [candidate division Zixibacteria bacterium]
MRATVAAVAVCVLLASSAVAAINGPLFESSIQNKVAPEPYRVSVADFNNDGINDMACAHYTGDSIAVMIGNGDGDFQPAVFYTIGSWQTDIQAANIDGDAAIELVVATSSNVYTLDNNGDGTFAAAVQISGLANNPRTIRLALVDGDANLDLIVAHYDNVYTDLSVWDNDGSGNFTFDNQYTVGTYQTAMAVGDFDGINGPDVVVGTTTPDYSVLLNDGSGGYSVHATYPLASTPRGMCAANFDGGADIEIAISRYQSLTVYSNDGNGNFSVFSSLGTLDDGYCLSAADFDGSNGPDVALTDDTTYVY